MGVYNRLPFFYSSKTTVASPFINDLIQFDPSLRGGNLLEHPILLQIYCPATDDSFSNSIIFSFSSFTLLVNCLLISIKLSFDCLISHMASFIVSTATESASLADFFFIHFKQTRVVNPPLTIKELIVVTIISHITVPPI